MHPLLVELSKRFVSRLKPVFVFVLLVGGAGASAATLAPGDHEFTLNHGHSRRSRGGGSPENRAHTESTSYWIPACAGMTIFLRAVRFATSC